VCSCDGSMRKLTLGDLKLQEKRLMLENNPSDLRTIPRSRQVPFQKRFFDLFMRFSSFRQQQMQNPALYIVLLIIVTRLLFIFFTDWGLDFEWYVEKVRSILAGGRLYVDVETTHMPLTDFLYVAMYFLNPWKSNVFALRFFLKLPFLLSDVGIAIVVMKIIEQAFQNESTERVFLDVTLSKRVRQAKFSAGLFIAFGLPLLLQTGGGRYDSLFIFCLVIAVFSLQKGQFFAVGLFASLGTSVKYIGVLFLPFVIVWLKKKDILPFLVGFLVGLIPIYPFLLFIPHEFINVVFMRTDHIAYGFSLWHGIYILWNGFMMKHVESIGDTYNIADEPFFIRNFYLPFFIFLFSVIFIFYLKKNWENIRTKKVSQMPILYQVNLVFLPFFIFALTFKAINIQVLAWFLPYIALHRKKGLLIEYSFLTIIHGFALLIFEAPQIDDFLMKATKAVGSNSFFFFLIVKPVVFLANFPSQIFVGIIFLTIFWFNIRTFFELISIVREETANSKLQGKISTVF